MENNKKFCKFCGEKIDGDVIVCTKCGRQLKAIKKENNDESKKINESNYDEKSMFYTRVWFMWIMLIFFAPVGIFLMWKFHPEMKKNTKIILTIVFAILFFFVIISGSEEESNVRNNNGYEVSNVKVEVINFSAMHESEILTWCNEKKINCNFKREYSSIVAKVDLLSRVLMQQSK